MLNIIEKWKSIEKNQQNKKLIDLPNIQEKNYIRKQKQRKSFLAQ